MFKKFFRKVRETVKKVAPIAAPIAGMALGPGWGAGIGASLGQYGGTKGSLQGAMLGGLGGLLGGPDGLLRSGNLFTKANAVPKSIAEAAAGGNKLALKNAITNASVGPTGIGKMLGMLKNPWVSGGLLAGIGALMNKEDEDDNRRPDIEIGSEGQLGDMRVADIEYLPANVPLGPPGYVGYANGGIVALAEGGMPPKNVDDFPRKNGKIAGPGTMTSDDIPAMLSDGEFVTKAVSVIGAGVREGANTIEEAREKGSDFFYQQQEDLAKLGERIVNGN